MSKSDKNRSDPLTPIVVIETLEQRLLYSADLFPGLAESATADPVLNDQDSSDRTLFDTSANPKSSETHLLFAEPSGHLSDEPPIRMADTPAGSIEPYVAVADPSSPPEAPFGSNITVAPAETISGDLSSVNGNSPGNFTASRDSPSEQSVRDGTGYGDQGVGDNSGLAQRMSADVDASKDVEIREPRDVAADNTTARTVTAAPGVNISESPGDNNYLADEVLSSEQTSAKGLNATTVSFWLYADSIESNELLYQAAADRGSNAGLSLLRSGAEISVVIHDSTSLAHYQTASSPVDANSWTHITVTVSDAASALFINGMEHAAKRQSGATDSVFANDSTISPAANLPTAGDRSFKATNSGFIDDARVYDYALSASAAHSLYTSGQLATDTELDQVGVGSPRSVATSERLVFDHQALDQTLALTVEQAVALTGELTVEQAVALTGELTVEQADELTVEQADELNDVQINEVNDLQINDRADRYRTQAVINAANAKDLSLAERGSLNAQPDHPGDKNKDDAAQVLQGIAVVELSDEFSDELPGEVVGELVDEVAVGVDELADELVDAVAEEAAVFISEPAPPIQETELVFIDTTTPEYQQIIDDLYAQEAQRNFEIVLISANQNGVSTITETLAGHNHIAAVHIISHGSDGAVQLGGSTLNNQSLQGYAADMQSWKVALNASADILFYGCDLARSAQGQLLLDSISELTGVDVAGSDDATGHKSLGADWDLEYVVGNVNTDIVLSPQLQLNWQQILASYTVTNTLDDGSPGSLRWAIDQTNASFGVIDTINFDIAGGGSKVINIGSTLSIIDRVVIDGTTQTDWVEDSFLPIVLDGNDGAFEGITLTGTADGSTVRGLVIRDFGLEAISIAGGSNGNLVAGNWIGQFNSDGSDAGAAEVFGAMAVYVGGNYNTVGGTTAADRNVIVDGINLYSSSANNNLISGNYIGTDTSGISLMSSGSGSVGVFATNNAANNTIGGASDLHRNIFGGLTTAIDLQGGLTNLYTIQNNWIGLGADGTTVLGNGDGIYLDGGDNHTIGGVDTGNVIVASGTAIDLYDSTDSNVILGNYIGQNESGTVVAGNDVGISVDLGSSDNTIGGIAAGEGNVITASASDGIETSTSIVVIANNIRGNSIYGNAGLGIDLNNDGVTVNDTGDSDTGPNSLQNWAVLTSASIADDGTFSYQLDTTSLAGGTYTIDFYASSERDGGQVEGQRYLGELTGVSGGSSTLTGSVPGITLTPGEFVTLITTDASGSSSEFSNYAVATDSDAGGTTPTDLQPTTTSGGGLSINEDGGDDIYLKAADGIGAGNLNALTYEFQFNASSVASRLPFCRTSMPEWTR